MSDEGVSIKAKARIKKMVKLRVLEKGPKLVKRQKNQPHSGAKEAEEQAGCREGSKGRSPHFLLRGHSCVWSDNTYRHTTQLPWLAGRFWKGTLTTEGPGSAPIRRGDGGEGSLPAPRRPAPSPGPAAGAPRSVHALSPLARTGVVPSVQPQRPGVHAVVDGAILEVKVMRGT